MKLPDRINLAGAGVCLILSSIMFCACVQSHGPTAPQPSINDTLTLAGYGEAVDSTYLKVWSDGSWEAFDGDTTINGTTYSTIADAYGDVFFYGPDGSYDGFWYYDEDLIIFDAPLPGVPDTMAGGVTYPLTTTFSDQGVSYLLQDDETLLDTGSVAVPFGTFNCLVLNSYMTISSGNVLYGASNTDYWLAKGPSDIQQWDFDLYNPGLLDDQIDMAYGDVNDQWWGVTSPSMALKRPASKISSAAKQPNSLSHSRQFKFDMRTVGPLILKGIRR
ncbi:MAG: hypothetical protein ACLP05_09405 [Candidatus Kryptoniota bacterium]